MTYLTLRAMLMACILCTSSGTAHTTPFERVTAPLIKQEGDVSPYQLMVEKKDQVIAALDNDDQRLFNSLPVEKKYDLYLIAHWNDIVKGSSFNMYDYTTYKDALSLSIGGSYLFNNRENIVTLFYNLLDKGVSPEEAGRYVFYEVFFYDEAVIKEAVPPIEYKDALSIFIAHVEKEMKSLIKERVAKSWVARLLPISRWMIRRQLAQANVILAKAKKELENS